MKTEHEITNALTNTKHYMNRVIELAHDQFDYDLEHFDLWEDDGQKRMQYLCIIEERAQSVCTACHHMELLIAKAMSLETPRMQLEEVGG